MPHVRVGLVIATWLWISNAIVISHSDKFLFPDLNPTAVESASGFPSRLNTSLGVPLRLTSDMGFWAISRGADTRAGPFEEALLIECIVVMISRISWSDPENVPITGPKMEERCKDMLFTIQPTLLPGADFTTYKAGIAFLLTLRQLFNRPLWPRGHLTIEIAKYDTAKAPRPWGLPIGVIYIEKLVPELRTMMNLTASENSDGVLPSIPAKSEINSENRAGNSTNDDSLATERPLRRRKWLGGYVKLVTWIFGQAWDSRVQQSLPVGPHTFPMALHLRSEFDPEMEANITVLRDAGDMLWVSVLGAAIELCEIAARNDRWDYQEAIFVADQSQPSVRLSIGPTWKDGPR